MTTLPPVRPGCGQCESCRYLKYLRPDIVTALIAPAFRERTRKSWDRIQAKHPCNAERKPADAAKEDSKEKASV